MSFDLFIFERRPALKTSVEIGKYLDEFLEDEEENSDDSPENSSPAIRHWAKKMFERFPPMNGPDAPSEDEIESNPDLENRLGEYSFGAHGAFVSFAFSVAEEAVHYLQSFADEVGVGIYDFQSDQPLFGKGIEQMKYRTEEGTDLNCDWEDVEASVRTMDDPERGRSNRSNAFVTVWFECDGEETACAQCTPNYPPTSFFGKLFFGHTTEPSYFFEILKDDRIYQKELPTMEALVREMKAFCTERREFDFSEFEEIFI